MKPEENLLENKKAFFDYEILEKFEAGLVLFGHEVKALKSKKGSIIGSYVVIKGSGVSPELYLIGATVSPYQPGNTPKDYDQKRSRKLLMKKKEIFYLTGKMSQKSLTLVPIRVYTVKGNLKLEFGLGRGKKQYDKRETIRKRETEKEIRRALKSP